MEWEYYMRREMQEVVPGIYLGPVRAATKSQLENLQSAGITHIVCVRHKTEARLIRPMLPDHFQYLVIETEGSVDVEDVTMLLPQFKTFVDDCLNEGSKVLVHGNTGTCRSAALLIAYIMDQTKMRFSQALEIISQRRRCISLSVAYYQKLYALEPVIQARSSMSSQGTQTENEGSNKRKLDDLEK